MEYPIRPITPDEIEPFFKANAAGFGRDYNPERLTTNRAIGEFGRTTSVWDGDQVVGTAGIWSFETTVPGGVLPAAGVTWVTVRPTHRRKGILTAMMRAQLDAVHERGEPLATLWASEAVIYGRFGYGCGAEGAELRIDPRRAALTRPGAAPGRCRFVEREDALRAWPAVYDRARLAQPGMHSRHAGWWQHRLFNPVEWPMEGFGGSFFVQYAEAGEVLGYVRYRIRLGDTDGLPDGKLRVLELMALTDAAYSALWEYVLGVDLIGEVTAPVRKVDEPLAWMLTDPRQLHRSVQDTLWVRLVDVPAALAGRRYLADGQLVVEVVDDFCPWNTGRYVLEGGPGGATCLPTIREPRVTLKADALGAVFLGGVRFQTLARAGRVQGTEEAIRLADRMFQWDSAPWDSEIF